MEEKKEKSFEDIFSEAKIYLDNRVEYTKLLMLKRVSRLLAGAISSTIVVVCFIFAFILGTLTLALFLADIFGSYPAGFGTVALIYLAIALVVSAKKQAIEKSIVDLTIKKHFKKLQEEEEEDEQKL